ncbi:helix-turn-helix domain-containing protein [Arthrobacter sp. ISL-95]|uniref:helix-turn-helix domain-containing protein n=1 Tax=Arthrobacter sp. ISL-95 TaxID=2819116 RepID=UPI0025703383|nr:helix-turn-helix transcriptional regulator [Arthrobacter sp. ISL-95]
MPERQAAMLEIARQVLAARLTAGLSQHELADRAEVSRPSVARVERGDDVNTSTLGRIAATLGLSLQLKNQAD